MRKPRIAKPTTAKAPIPASQLASIRLVAARAGVSIATVSRVVNGATNRVGKDTVKRVEKIIADLNYRPQGAGRSLRTRQTRIVAVLVPDVTNIMGAIALSVDAALRAEGHMMFLCNTHGDPNLQDEYLQEVRSHLVSGIVMIGAVSSPALEKLALENEQIVFVIRKSPYSSPAAYVGVDQYLAGRDVATRLAQQGYQRIAMIHGSLASSANRELLHGFKDGLSNAGAVLPPSYTRETPSWSIEGGYIEGSALLDLDPRPQAIFCAGDKNAYGVFRRCSELNLRVPQDVCLFGFEDNPLNKWLAPWLSTVSVPYERFGPVIFSVLQQLKRREIGQGMPQVILPHDLVLRN
jgi:LacI family transcriptional regulator